MHRPCGRSAVPLHHIHILALEYSAMQMSQVSLWFTPGGWTLWLLYAVSSVCCGPPHARHTYAHENTYIHTYIKVYILVLSYPVDVVVTVVLWALSGPCGDLGIGPLVLL